MHDMALLAFSFIVIPFAAKRTGRFYFAKEHLLILLLALWAFAVLRANAPQPERGFLFWSMYLMPSILFLSVSQLVFFKRGDGAFEKGWMIWGILLAAELFISLSILSSRGGDLHEIANIYWARSNYIAALLELPILWSFHRMHGGGPGRAAAGLAFAGCLGALFLTVSRGGIVTILASLLLYSLLRKKIVPVFVIGILAAVLLPMYSTRFTAFFDSGNVDRIYLWLQSIQLISKNPLVGYGPGNIPLLATLFSKTDIMPDPHNFILTILLHTGCVGLLIFCILMVVFVRRAIVVYKKRGNPFFLVFLFSAFFHGSVEPTFLGFSYSFLFWYCMATLLIQSEEAGYSAPKNRLGGGEGSCR
jgi:O-antigen ligase